MRAVMTPSKIRLPALPHLAAVLGLLCSCFSVGEDLMPAPRTPALTTVASHKAAGVLVVRTEPLEFEDETFVYHVHRPYDIFLADGEYLRHVNNHLAEWDEDPARVRLSPGTYRLSIDRESGPDLVVDVQVEARELTEVDVCSLIEEQEG